MDKTTNNIRMRINNLILKSQMLKDKVNRTVWLKANNNLITLNLIIRDDINEETATNIMEELK